MEAAPKLSKRTSLEQFRFERQSLVMMLGVQGSGKSYFARQLAEAVGASWLNSDSLNTARRISFGWDRPQSDEEQQWWQEMEVAYGEEEYYYHKCLIAILKSGRSAVGDKIHFSRRDRDYYRKEAADLGVETSITVWVEIPIDLAIERVSTREDNHWQRSLPEDEAKYIIENELLRISEPEADELFVQIDGQRPFEDQLQLFITFYRDAVLG